MGTRKVMKTGLDTNRQFLRHSLSRPGLLRQLTRLMWRRILQEEVCQHMGSSKLEVPHWMGILEREVHPRYILQFKAIPEMEWEVLPRHIFEFKVIPEMEW